MQKNTAMNPNQSANVTSKELSLEEIDVLCRKYHHLHDEEVLHIIGRFFSRLKGIFKHDQQQHCHSSVR